MTPSNSSNKPPPPALDAVTLSEEALKGFLAWMDAQPQNSQAGRRKHERYSYHCKGLIVTIDQGGYRCRCTAPIRNISNGGISLLHRAMIHVGRPCELQIRTPANQWIHATGKVAWARYVTQGIYEIGVQFDEEIDASPFKDAELPGAAVSSQRSAGGRQPGR